ncbi:F-box/kelch-repeat protein At3g06240-like [Papaver somniferum]|uniref:F-box/kelch-repeat protein At3g06240-like n=1 Tax=Papaver somniferum TaxID=3469 RepID=UPI000E6FCD56|nr:F-box/kelch-repeat protein At3g06240-like [Papaver somniferum]
MSSLLLPEDIISNILSRLPVKSILRFRCVCKSWCRLFRDPNFIKLHLDRETEKENFSLMWDYKNMICSTDYNYEYSSSSLSSVLYNETVNADCTVDRAIQYKFYDDYEKQMRNRTCDSYFSMDGFKFISSCNGVVCLTAPGLVLLWNPCTRETRKIPRKRGCIGFGCDSETGDFKMVELASINTRKRRGVYSNREDLENNILRVYSFESNSWRVIPKIPYKHTSYDIVFFEGAFHWLASPSNGSEDSKQVLVSFAMLDESFQEVLLPQHLYRYNITSSATTVAVVGGFLALIYTVYNIRTEIWVMKDNGGRNSWTELCIMDLQIICEHPVTRSTFIRSFKNGELLFQKSSNQDGRHLFLYDPIHGKGRAIDIHSMPPQFTKYYISISSYIRTLASVGSNTQRKITLRDRTVVCMG